MASPVAMHWTPLARLGFRVTFLYFLCFMLFCNNGTIFEIFPVVGDWIDSALTWPINHLAEWTGNHVFHLTGIAAKWHPTGSGDTTLNWISYGIFIVFSLTGGLVWTAIAERRGNRRTEYQTLYAWLRFGLRLSCGMYMMIYGLAKLYPHQMAPISIAILNEPVGQSSPMTLLWSLIGMNPIYEIICGSAEVLGGVLFLFRRTALAGALLSSFVMANVVLYNFFFDVPVKLFAINLLLASLFVVLPDFPALFSFFWKHQPSAPTGVWIPPISRKGFRIATRVIELVFVIGFLVYMPVTSGINWYHYKAGAKVATPLLGAWKVDANQSLAGPFLDPEGLPITDLYLDTAVRAFSRSTDRELWRTPVKLDNSRHTIQLGGFMGESETYTWTLADGSHLVLTATPPEKPKNDAKPKPFVAGMIKLTRTPVPDHYPLLDRGFHLINQWGLER